MKKDDFILLEVKIHGIKATWININHITEVELVLIEEEQDGSSEKGYHVNLTFVNGKTRSGYILESNYPESFPWKKSWKSDY